MHIILDNKSNHQCSSALFDPLQNVWPFLSFLAQNLENIFS